MPTARSLELRQLAQRIADALPSEVVEEVVLTGSVSREVADERSDIEMLVVTRGQQTLEECFGYACGAGLSGLGSWGPQATRARRVSGYREGVPIELIWWHREFAEERLAAVLAGEPSTTPDALVHGKALRGGELLRAWQERLAEYPPELAAARIEAAALTWGGFAAEGLLTITRPGERYALLERLLDDANRVVTIVFALNRVWEPTHKRLAARVAALPVQPERLAERIDAALAEPDPDTAARLLAELQLETVELAPSGPNIDRARVWLRAVLEVLA